MPNVVFVAPFVLDTTARFLSSMASLEGVRLGIVSQEAADRLPEDVRRRASSFRQVGDALDPDSLTEAVRELSRAWEGQLHALAGVLEQLQVPLAVVRERLGVPGMDVETARNFRDKARMKDVLRASGLPCARHRLAASAREAVDFAAEAGFPLVIKPPAGAGARSTFRVSGPEELEASLRSMPPSEAEPVLLEEFVTGREHSLDSVSLGGRVIFQSISRYDPSPLEVMRTPWIQWCVLLPRRIDGPEYADALEVGRRALSALGMVTGLTHMEWFRREDGRIAISEVAARPPGAQFTTLISYAHDFDLYRAWARLMAFGEFDPPQRRYAAGAAFLRGQGSGRVMAIHGLERAQRELGELVVEVKLPKPGQQPASTYEGEGYVILRHPDTRAVEEGLRRLVGIVRVELA